MILAFDTSSPVCAVALVSGDDVLASAEEPMAKGQAERLFVLCQELLESANVTYADLHAVGVGIGPGNFTGIRISVSAARGLALGLGVPAVGISAFDALRFGTNGPCVCAVDARRDQIFIQGYDNPNLATPALYDCANLPAFDGPLIGSGGQSPAGPFAVAIAHLTEQRYRHNLPRPAPLYLRPVDAAPARDKAPTLLP